MAGQSPGTRGCPFKIGPELLDAAAAKCPSRRRAGWSWGSRIALQSLKAATASTVNEVTTKKQGPDAKRLARLKQYRVQEAKHLK